MRKSAKKFKSFGEFLEEDYFKIGKSKGKKKSESVGSNCNDDN